ncbi:glycosyltransferase, partial [bacterium]|nr:glycosyltransferase [bacterium]
MTEFLTGYSIIIPVYNGTKTLPDTLNSVMRMEGADYEVIVVDDASTDNTVEVAAHAGACVVALETNSGPATARNRGAQEAKYDKIVFTDSDVLVSKNLLQQLENHFQQSGADCVQGIFSEVCPFANFCSQYKNLYNRYVLSQLPGWIDTTYTSLTAVKTNAFLQCGGFDENIRGASVEDRTLGRNLKRSGFKIWLARDIEVLHNKKLTFKGFLLNQYRRSRDLIKLLLRNREEKHENAAPTVA